MMRRHRRWVEAAFGRRLSRHVQMFIQAEIGSVDGRRMIVGTELFRLDFLQRLRLMMLTLMTVPIELELERMFAIHSSKPLIVVTVYQAIQWIIMNAEVLADELLLL